MGVLSIHPLLIWKILIGAAPYDDRVDVSLRPRSRREGRVVQCLSNDGAFPGNNLVVQQGKICASNGPGGSLITDVAPEVKGVTGNRPRRVWRRREKTPAPF